MRLIIVCLNVGCKIDRVREIITKEVLMRSFFLLYSSLCKIESNPHSWVKLIPCLPAKHSLNRNVIDYIHEVV